MRLRSCLVLLLLAAASSVAAAKDMIRANPAEFPALRAEIQKALKGEAYSELTRTEREEVTAALDRMEKALASVDSVKDLDNRVQTQLFNDQELVNTVLTKAAADSRTVCRQQVRTGSHRHNQVCRTQGEIRREREEAQRQLGRIQGPSMRPPSDG